MKQEKVKKKEKKIYQLWLAAKENIAATNIQRTMY